MADGAPWRKLFEWRLDNGSVGLDDLDIGLLPLVRWSLDVVSVEIPRPRLVRYSSAFLQLLRDQMPHFLLQIILFDRRPLFRDVDQSSSVRVQSARVQQDSDDEGEDIDTRCDEDVEDQPVPECFVDEMACV